MMKRVRGFCFALALVGFLVCSGATDSPVGLATPEFRAMWITRFEWVDPSPDKCRETIRRVMKALADSRFNTVFFQVRGQGDTLYPSPYEVWSPLLGGKDPGWDPLAFAIEEAHKRGLEFHAYLNSNTCWYDNGGQLPRNPKHLFYRHCNIAGYRDWLIHDDQGKPVQWRDNYVWIAPGIPEYQAYFRRVVVDLVSRYDLDGVHIDRIRLPGPEFSHDPISLARLKGPGNPQKLGFEDWTRDQFTRLLSDLYGEVSAIRPGVKLSVTPVGLYDRSHYPAETYKENFNYGRTRCYQDAQAWLKAGIVDFAAPQIYWADDGNKPDYSEVLRDWMANRGERLIIAGESNARVSVREMIRQVEVSRRMGASGQSVFSWSSTPAEEFQAYRAGPYAVAAPVPELPLKSRPTTGAIVGTVSDRKTGKPIVDVWITSPGLGQRTWLSSGDGFFAILHLNPGPHNLEFKKDGYVPATAGGIVEVGKSNRFRIELVRKE